MLRAIAFVLALLVAAASLFVVAGRTAPPTIDIRHPENVVGQSGTIEVVVGAPGKIDTIAVTLEQDGKTLPLFSLDAPQSGTLEQTDAEHVRITRPFGKRGVPELQAGTARIVVSASRSSFLSLRTVSASATRDVQVRLQPPRVEVLSTHHHVNHGGAEMVVYRVTPPDVQSGVRVGDVEYVGYPASGAGMAGADASDRVAFFALLHDQDLGTSIRVFARDEAGNEASTAFIEKVFAKPFRRSRIQVDDRFLQRVVPEIRAYSPELGQSPTGDTVSDFIRINNDLRRLNADKILALAKDTAPTRLWSGSFLPLGNAQVEASFADHRTYTYAGKEIDQQVHLGFDLAVTSAIPVAAENAGRVMLAEWLGIFGNCVIIDHGMGVGSLYAHLSAVDVKVGDPVARGQIVGRSGMTGLAAGDHLHFTVLVGGRPVNPVEWWDPHWIQDRVERKLVQDTGGIRRPSAR
jgi:murein DD-endopeptidase MepM/ murein hydrolase activator NlpD